MEDMHDGFLAYEIYINGSRAYARDPSLATTERLVSLMRSGENDIYIVRQHLP